MQQAAGSDDQLVPSDLDIASFVEPDVPAPVHPVTPQPACPYLQLFDQHFEHRTAVQFKLIYAPHCMWQLTVGCRWLVLWRWASFASQWPK